MKVSLNTIKQLIEFELPPVGELVSRINQQLGQVEEVIDLKQKYAGAVIVRVIDVVDHENSDHLHVCKVDDGGAVTNIERDENGYVQVVCGAPNVHADMWAVWLPPRATVPATFDDDEPFVLDARELRGVMSYGMLAAGDELAINSDHDGIIELTEQDLPPELEGRGLGAGQDFAELFGLDDTIIDIENKMFTHRPDCFGQIGIAREIAGIFGHTFTSPDWYLTAPQPTKASGLDLDIFNETEKAPRVMAVAMDGVAVRRTPFWMQAMLVRWGSKPINNVVDMTNYIMLLTAQPTHAYDYDKLRGHKLGARMARDGEKIALLNGKTYTLTPDDIVMADADGPVGIAGVMGGSESEVDVNTKRIVLEVANFDMYAVRKSSMRHGLFTDALTRFNKGQSPLQNDRIIAALMQGMTDHAGATQASSVYDSAAPRSAESAKPLTLTSDFINERLGSALDTESMVHLLTNVEISCEMQAGNPSLTVTPPFWRTDIEIPEDVVEEVGRLYGFDKLPRELPLRSSAPAPKNSMREFKQALRESLSRSGANEVLTYSFVHENVMTRAEQTPSEAFRLSNALSPELQYFRLGVLPSLLDKVHMNIKSGFDEFTLFEIGKGHAKNLVSDEDTLPVEAEYIDGVYASKSPRDGAPYYHVRRVITQLARDLGMTLKFEPASSRTDDATTVPFELSRSARISIDNEYIGIVGELKQSVRKHFKLPDYTAAFSLDIAALQRTHSTSSRQYVPLSRFPSLSQDISLKTSNEITYTRLLATITSALEQLSSDIKMQITPVSVYRAADDTDTKTTTFHIEFVDYEKTLTDADIKPLMDHIASVALRKLYAERV